jgi:hypothetical protein
VIYEEKMAELIYKMVDRIALGLALAFMPINKLVSAE